jgi:pimeloyl-ACP methyl ester carboxylesterase
MTGPMHYDWSLCYSAEEMRELAETRVLTLNGLRPDDRVTRVSASLLERFDTVDQAALCNGILCPTLLINGGGDDEERRLAANSVRAISLLPAGSRLLVLSEASHNFAHSTRKSSVRWPVIFSGCSDIRHHSGTRTLQ